MPDRTLYPPGTLTNDPAYEEWVENAVTKGPAASENYLQFIDPALVWSIGPTYAIRGPVDPLTAREQIIESTMRIPITVIRRNPNAPDLNAPDATYGDYPKRYFIDPPYYPTRAQVEAMLPPPAFRTLDAADAAD